VPDDVLKAWARGGGSRGAAEHRRMAIALLGTRPRASARNSKRRVRHERPASLAKELKTHKKALLEKPLVAATRKSSEAAIEVIAAAMPMEFVAGSADPPAPTNNKAKSATALCRQESKKGRFIHYGVREHGMAAAMNGIFLHGGFAPTGRRSWCSPIMRAARCGSPPADGRQP